MEIKKTTKYNRDFFEVKKKRQVETINGDLVEIYDEPQLLEVVDLEGRKRVLEKMIAEHQEELSQINDILKGIKDIENNIKK